MEAKKFFLDQHGCAKNQVDGEILVTRLLNKGFLQTFDAQEADLIIVNSCGFIQSAKEESLNSLLEARQEYPNAKIVLAGCLAERYAEQFKKDLPEADAIFGNGDLSLIDSTVDSLFAGQRPVVKALQKGVCCGNRNLLLNYKGSAYVKITEGCNNCCSFCAIPLIRGQLRSRKISEIVDEIKELLKRGVKEFNLIGQDLAAFGCGKDDFVFDAKESGGASCEKSKLLCLLEKIAELKGNFWVRLLYIHPDHFNTDILPLLQKDKRFLPYFDIPFQSGDDTIIRAMNRRGTFDSYAGLVEKIRSDLGECCIRTTFLTGFPGESDEQAGRTLDFMKKIQPDWSGCFAYSREEDTPAAKFKDQVPKKKAQAREKKLQALQEEITQERLSLRIGKIYPVLIEEIVQAGEDASEDEGLAIGRSWFQAPEVDGSFVVRYDADNADAVRAVVPGSIVNAKALAVSGVDIDSELVL
ncbi:MAG: 30S ribosomal protein S12 methylthiotransferase RimO [Treponema sp.]|nr:30S ribosomal protein S12 methylthiotransferase RimO [Treponema sp.]MBQ1714429.1 30S ribosomal protein S12 methylthiotransferase RimO [Treponema sp.]MBQ2356116.1 30S ribosomal protein S12 methylthiotransferase RimO [Treponema sp.]MBQ4024347.1 30S ribosomal protein S12 methylthiotransferase RimO [Treponema sp.]MBQ5569789.1 30S ribosomal protein S12 methylthiotransferase RimO [Treponema sp.]